MNVDALKALILSQQQQLRSKDEQLLSKDQQLLSKDEQLLSRDYEIEHLKLLIAKLQRMQFGRKSEKVERQIEQLTLKLEELETSRAEHEQAQESATAPNAVRAASAKRRPSRRPLPAHLLRVTKVHEPAQPACPQCGGALQKLGEDISEVLDYIPASFFVIRHVRPKLSCCACDAIVQAAAPSRPIERGLAGAGLLAHVLTAKYCDHLPLYRQHEMYAREGVDLDRSTLATWVGQAYLFSGERTDSGPRRGACADGATVARKRSLAGAADGRSVGY
jgi:transposase